MVKIIKFLNLCMKKQIFILFLLVGVVNQCISQMYVQIGNMPAHYTPIFDTLYMPGSHNNWNPATATHQFDLDHRIRLDSFSGTIEFKVTRGNWETVEANANGNDIANRILTYAEGQEVIVDIPEWRDLYRSSHTATTGVHIMKTSFYMPQFNRNRRIWIYLPQDYFLTTHAYPVLYMHDGQNLFDAPYSFVGEWKVDESMLTLANASSSDCIVIGIDNGGGNRIEEYTPYQNPTYGGGRGEDYATFLVETLKPFIDNNFRTLPQPAHTGIAGSSLGGLISFYAGLTYPDVFGKVGVFSPSFWYSDSLMADVKDYEVSPGQLFYIMGARNESSNMEPDIDKYIQLLRAQGVAEDQIARVIRPNGAHSEWFWAQEFTACYEWLDLWNDRLDVRPSPTAIKHELFEVIGSPSFQPGIFSLKPVSGKKQITIFDRRGQIIERSTLNDSGCYTLSDSIPGGAYFALVQVGRYRQSLKLVKF